MDCDSFASSLLSEAPEEFIRDCYEILHWLQSIHFDAYLFQEGQRQAAKAAKEMRQGESWQVKHKGIAVLNTLHRTSGIWVSFLRVGTVRDGGNPKSDSFLIWLTWMVINYYTCSETEHQQRSASSMDRSKTVVFPRYKRKFSYAIQYGMIHCSVTPGGTFPTSVTVWRAENRGWLIASWCIFFLWGQTVLHDVC